MVELMISIVILVLISTATLFSLRSTRERDELNTAARLLASDIRNVQQRALTGRNVLSCDGPTGVKRVCGADAIVEASCAGPCAPSTPPRVGVSLAAGSETYDLFADVGGADWRKTGDTEVFIRRNLNPIGGSKVEILRLAYEGLDLPPVPKADIAVGRQSGAMRIDACGDPGLPACAPTEPKGLVIELQHRTTGDTAVIEVNAVTGRVSIQ